MHQETPLWGVASKDWLRRERTVKAIITGDKGEGRDGTSSNDAHKWMQIFALCGSSVLFIKDSDKFNEDAGCFLRKKCQNYPDPDSRILLSCDSTTGASGSLWSMHAILDPSLFTYWTHDTIKQPNMPALVLCRVTEVTPDFSCLSSSPFACLMTYTWSRIHMICVHTFFQCVPITGTQHLIHYCWEWKTGVCSTKKIQLASLKAHAVFITYTSVHLADPFHLKQRRSWGTKGFV